MGIAAFFRSRGVPSDSRRLSRYFPSVRIGDLDVVLCHDRHIALFEIHDVPGMREHGHDVRGDVGRLFRSPDNQRTPRSRRDQTLRFFFTDHREGVAAADFPRSGTHGIGEIQSALQMLVDEMSDNLGIRLGLKGVALFLQLLFERLVVLDDPVVDEHTSVGPMRMRILLRRFAVSRPTGMANADQPVDGLFRQRLLQIRELTDAPAHFDFFTLHHRHAGRVVAAVFEFGQPGEQNGDRFLVADISDDTAHRFNSRLSVLSS